MENLLPSGNTKAIGISNFSRAELERLLEETSVVPAVHHMELHPWLQQKSFIDLHREKNIHVTQYSPFGNQNEIYDNDKIATKLMDDPMLVKIGMKYGKSGAQVALAWGIAHGRSVLPKSKTPSRIESNLQGDFVLDNLDVEAIDASDKKLRFSDPSGFFPGNYFADLDGKAF
jgi:diketogulonate reductase-like aldo/keto reductase